MNSVPFSEKTIANLCRTCMSSNDNLTSLFSVLSLSGKEEALNSILYKCTSIQVCTTDVLPQSICSSCLEKLAICYLYRELCFETQTKLQQLNESHKQLYNNIDDTCIVSPIVSPNTDLKKSDYNNYKTVKPEFDIENSKEHTQLNLLRNSTTPSQDFEENENLEQTCDFEYLDCDNKNTYEDSDQGTKYKIEENVLEFICNICSKKCKSKYSLNRHLKTHTHIEELKCHICMKQFTRAADVKRHLITHTGEKPYVCNICKSSFTQSGSLAVHIRHQHKNSEPTKQPPNPYEPNCEKSDKSYLCSTCGTRFRHSSTLKIHFRRHLGVKPYECRICNIRFVSSGRLRSHIRVHTGERPFACRVCNKTFAHSTVLSRHLKAHANVKPYKCSYCPKQFLIPYYLNIHLRKHTGEKPLSCSTCGKRFACPKVLSQHEKIHSSERPFLCMNCGKSFRRAQHLKSHMKLHAT